MGAGGGGGGGGLFSVYFSYLFAMKPKVCLLTDLFHGCLGDRGLSIELLIYLSNAILPHCFVISTRSCYYLYPCKIAKLPAYSKQKPNNNNTNTITATPLIRLSYIR